MCIRIFQKGFNYSQDGPGNRLVYHLQGCNMRCPWCANPEGLDPRGGAEYDADDILEEISRSRSMFFDGGGVTFTGGEPTLQFDVLFNLLRSLKEKGINTALETNASHPRLPELFPYIDHLMMDLKHPEPMTHRNITGVDQAMVLQNIGKACALHPDLLIRIPVINGYNTSGEDFTKFAKLLVELTKKRVPIEVLRYHEYGRSKWERLGLEYTVSNGMVSDVQFSDFRMLLEVSDLTVKTT